MTQEGEKSRAKAVVVVAKRFTHHNCSYVGLPLLYFVEYRCNLPLLSQFVLSLLWFITAISFAKEEQRAKKTSKSLPS
jgi:hypothetical protein